MRRSRRVVRPLPDGQRGGCPVRWSCPVQDWWRVGARVERCDHRTVRARVGVAGEPLAWDGSSAGSPLASPTTTSASGSILRRFIGSEQTMRSGVPPPVVLPAIGQPPEAELAESLETVLRIIGRLAASHDRRELVGMIVDETMHALHVDAATIRLLRE